MENLYKKLTGNDLVYTALIGKPSEITYKHGEDVLQEQARRMGVSPVNNIYFIGDNVCTDIIGANLYNQYLDRQTDDQETPRAKNCFSVLLETGVHCKNRDKDRGGLEHSARDFLSVAQSYKEPSYCSQHVLEAVQMIFRKECS